MQFTQTQAPVTVSGQALRTSEFQMKMNDKMFEIFSSSIYSNKIRAMVRELCTNAYDIHKTSGTPNIPFEVSIPTSDSPMFVVRDFGTGLSEEQIFQIYTVYFESTKDGDNEAHGGYGLGSKSPLAYVDSFQIRSYQDGVLKCYTCYRKNGTPMISLILETKTDEPNGLEVSVAVNESDINRFRTEIGYVLSTFPTKPTIMNGEVSYFDFSETEKDIFAIKKLPSNLVDRDNQFYVYIEPVLYPLQSDMRQIFKNSVVYKMFFGDSYDRFAFKFPIGSLAIPPSREQIDNTKQNIEVFQKFMNDLDALYQTKLDDLYEQSKDMEYKDAYNFVQEKIKEITSVEDSQLFRTFCRNVNYVYKHPFGDTKITKEKTFGEVDGKLEEIISKKTEPLEKIQLEPLLDVFKKYMRSRKVPFKYWTGENGTDIDFYYSYDLSRISEMVYGEKSVILCLQQKNYRKFLTHFYETIMTDKGVHRIYFVLDTEVSDLMERLNDYSITGNIKNIFPNLEIIDYNDLKKDYPLPKNTSGVGMSARGTKPHQHMILDGGAVLTKETSINDLVTLVDESDEVMYVRGDGDLANFYGNVVKEIRQSNAVLEKCEDLFKQYEGTLIFNTPKFDVTLAKMIKNGAPIKDVTVEFFEDLKSLLRTYFLTTENWIYGDSKDYINGLAYWFKYNKKIYDYLSSRYDVLYHRRKTTLREKSGDAVYFTETAITLRKFRNVDSDYKIFSREEYNEMIDYHEDLENLFGLRMDEVSKKVPLLVALLGNNVYNSDVSKTELIFQHLIEKGV